MTSVEAQGRSRTIDAGPYEVRISAGLSAEFAPIIAAAARAHCYAVITDDNVAPLHAGPLMTELAKEVEVPMRLVNLALEEMTEAVNRGWSDRDWLAGTLLQVERAGLDAADLRFSDDDVDAVQNRISPQPAQA